MLRVVLSPRLVALWQRVGLGAKMALIVVVGTIALVALFLYLGTAALNENIQVTLHERVILAQTSARHIDYVLTNIESVLPEVARAISPADSAALDETLARARQRLDLYTTQVIFLDRAGRALAAHPPLTTPIAFTQFASVNAVLGGQDFAVSRFARLPQSNGSAAIAGTPVRDATGAIVGALFIRIDLTSPTTRVFTDPIGLGESGYLDLIDLGGTILVSTRRERIGIQSDHEATLAAMIRDHRTAVSTCHDCHSASAPTIPRREVLAFAPLERAQWGVAVRQSEDEVFASIHQLQIRIFALMAIMLAGALMLVYLTTRSIITPVQALTAATQRIAASDLDTPLESQGEDEIGALARSFDAMRVRLKQSITEIETWNSELDARVQERTAECQQAAAEIRELYEAVRQKERARRELLNRVFSAQEEERKRISRELHDETCQVLTGLAYALDDAADTLSLNDLKPQLERMHELVTTALAEIHRIILDLRPTMLDHLGLLPALRWYAEARLNDPGIRFTLRETGEPRRLPPGVETALFRVIQEAINNIARHSRATRAEFTLEFAPTQVQVWITDNGKGFDAATVFGGRDQRRGLGLLGMQERMSAIGGRVEIQSQPGDGTAVQLTAPIADGG
ncbi:MAG: HAMP domain-containing protein [Chloroflexi bacterium]|nr:HAMP domain-containing protein [Chloroflexota bacterium]